MISPCCCGITLKRGVKLIALFELTASILTAISTVVLLANNSKNHINSINPGRVNDDSELRPTSTLVPFIPGKEINGFGPENGKSVEETAMVLFLLLLIGEIVLSWILYRGASQEKFRHLRTWWWIKLVMMACFLVFDMVDVFSAENRKLEFAICAQVLYQGYVLWLVKALIDEIRGVGPPRFIPLTQPKVTIEADDV